jgi:hypothetical protein
LRLSLRSGECDGDRGDGQKNHQPGVARNFHGFFRERKGARRPIIQSASCRPATPDSEKRAPRLSCNFTPLNFNLTYNLKFNRLKISTSSP